MAEVILDTVLDTLKILPFLFVTYLVMEWMEHETGNRMVNFLEKHRKAGPLFGSLFGLVPECGFSSASSSLYATNVITAGTLCAVYLSTSDEMLPILISARAGFGMIAPILAVKFVIALGAGCLADVFSIKRHTDIESFCEKEGCHCENSEEEGNIFHAALHHTAQITFWLFLVTLVINGFVEWIGMDTLRAFVTSHPASSILTCTLVGMIPSCASSILISSLYLEHVISFAAVCAGLLANAGVGAMILFRVSRNWKNNLKIVGYCWAVSLLSGLVLNLF